MIEVRPIEQSDLATLHHFASQNGQSYFLFESVLPLSYAEREEIYFQRKTSKLEFLAETPTGVPIGAVRVDAQTTRSYHWAISFAFFNRTPETIKLFTRAAHTFITNLFNDHSLERLYTCTLKEEALLHNFLTQLGFDKEAALKEHLLYHGTHHDIWIYGLLKEAFFAQRSMETTQCSVVS